MQSEWRSGRIHRIGIVLHADSSFLSSPEIVNMISKCLKKSLFNVIIVVIPINILALKC